MADSRLRLQVKVSIHVRCEIANAQEHYHHDHDRSASVLDTLRRLYEQKHSFLKVTDLRKAKGVSGIQARVTSLREVDVAMMISERGERL